MFTLKLYNVRFVCPLIYFLIKNLLLNCFLTSNCLVWNYKSWLYTIVAYYLCNNIYSFSLFKLFKVYENVCFFWEILVKFCKLITMTFSRFDQVTGFSDLKTKLISLYGWRFHIN